ncbi:hypothetical protein E4Q23_07640 [Candidatus Accumulibacter phosphatis]|uniref:Alkaline phosphatase n=1 Tax=Candidatus Accumulibacter phosphatis TaxID=327160 RepID=A0ABX1TW54_9PROT|nr:hypothetical protein [Candidatus Accumulibacter phosphatis]NMQ27636.1 hypothetical protein [Candidatus Accumulibacter phosphatis]
MATTFFNTLYGSAGNDLVDGQGGNDILVGGEGDDTIISGGGEMISLLAMPEMTLSFFFYGIWP